MSTLGKGQLSTPPSLPSRSSSGAAQALRRAVQALLAWEGERQGPERFTLVKRVRDIAFHFWRTQLKGKEGPFLHALKVPVSWAIIPFPQTRAEYEYFTSTN